MEGHHGGTPLVHHSTIILKGLKGTLNLTPMMPRDDNLSDIQCEIFQSGTCKHVVLGRSNIINYMQ